MAYSCGKVPDLPDNHQSLCDKFSVGETIELMKPNGDNIEVTVKKIVDEDGNEQESAPHPKQVLYIDLGGHADQYDILRRKED